MFAIYRTTNFRTVHVRRRPENFHNYIPILLTSPERLQRNPSLGALNCSQRTNSFYVTPGSGAGPETGNAPSWGGIVRKVKEGKRAYVRVVCRGNSYLWAMQDTLSTDFRAWTPLRPFIASLPNSITTVF